MYTSVSLRYLKIIHDFAVPLDACGVLRSLGSKAGSRLISHCMYNKSTIDIHN